MSSEFLVVNKKILPRYYQLVIAAKEILRNGNAGNVSEACEQVGISRSTFYKYQDYVFAYNEDQPSRKLVFSLRLLHQAGALSQLCNRLAELDVSILTVSQSIPIDEVASILVSCDISHIKVTVDELKKIISDIPCVSDLQLLAFER